jgi:spore germination protein GerM
MRYAYTLLILALLLTGCRANPPTDTPAASASASAAPQPTTTTVAEATPASQPTLVPTSSDAPAGSAAPQPSAPAATPTFTPPAQGTITISEPAAGATISNPVTIKGATDFWPFEATLTGRILDASGHQIGIGPVTVQAPEIGRGGPFEATIPFVAPEQAQAGTLELFEASAKDGSIVVKQTVAIQLAGEAVANEIQLASPTAGVAVTLPLHIALRTSQPDGQLTARLTFANGVTLEQPLTMSLGPDGVGYVVANMDWNTESAPPATEPGNATLEIVRGDGSVRQRVTVNVLPESQTQRVDVAWATPDGQIIVFKQAIGKQAQIASAALRELLNGPADGNLAGAGTALPTVGEIVTYAGRQPNWGYEVRLLKLTIENGVATANFSSELRAYGGGGARVQTIRQQIERTLKQFPSVQQVVIQIDGQSEGVLQP